MRRTYEPGEIILHEGCAMQSLLFLVQGKIKVMELRTDHIGEIASLLGTTHRHLNRVMHAFAQKGVLERNGQTIRILNWPALEHASNGIRYE